jgi:hypothetical protein
MDLMKQFSRKGFRKYAVGSPMDIKAFKIEKGVMIEGESPGQYIGTWQPQLMASFATTIMGSTSRDTSFLD